MEAFVKYEDFGAVGDGLTNDFFAMKAAHDYANKHNLPVRGTAGKSYLITETEVDGVAESIMIQTDTNWNGATIIIDDSDIVWVEGENKRHNTNTFVISSTYSSVPVEQKYIDEINSAGGIKKDSVKKINTGLGYPAMLVVTNTETKHYIRYGYENSGSSQKELVHVDADGNIDESTPFLFDYEQVTSITAYRTDIETLTLEGGTIISKASQVNIIDKDRKIARGIKVSRSNTHIKDIEHKITGEILKGEIVDGVPFIGHSYSAIISVQNAHNVLVENVIFQSRAYYRQGTYDISGYMSNMIVFKNCTQSNFFGGHMPEYPLMPSFGKWWGVAGTNSCKNMIYDTCKLTRYDAHTGVVNGKIINSEIASIRLTGGGDMLIENTKIYNWTNASTMQFREDYGCTWNGTVTLRNCEVIDVKGDSALTCVWVVRSANHNFGYKTYFPNLIIDNLKIGNAKPEVNLIYEFEMNPYPNGCFFRSLRDEGLATEGAICSDGNVNVNPYIPPKFIKVINNEQNGYELTLPDVPFFKDTEIVGVKKI